MSSGRRNLKSAAAAETPPTPEPISQVDAQKLANIVGWKHDNAARDMCELLYSVQGTAAILRRPPDRALHRDFQVLRRAFRNALEHSDWIDQREMGSLIIAGYQARHITGQDDASAPANLLKSDLEGLRRLISAIDFALETVKPRRGPPQVDPMIHIMVRELIWTYQRFVRARFRGVRAFKKSSPGPDFVRKAMAFLAPTAKKTQIDRAMRHSNLDLATAMYGPVDSARKRHTKKGANSAPD